MLSKKHFIFYALFSLLIFQIPAITLAQTKQGEKTASIRPFTDMTLEITVPEQSVFSLQPIPIIIKQTNNTSEAVIGYGEILFGFTPIRMYVKKIGSNERIAIGKQSTVSELGIFTNSEVAPGKTSVTKGVIMLGLKRYFSSPGIYEIQAELSNDDGTQFIESNKATFEVKTPTGSNLVVYNLIKNNSLEDFMFSGKKFSQAELHLQTITNLYPNTPYAKYSAFLLGETYLGRKQYTQALPYLLRLENNANFIQAEKVARCLTMIRNSLNVTEPAQ